MIKNKFTKIVYCFIKRLIKKYVRNCLVFQFLSFTGFQELYTLVFELL